MKPSAWNIGAEIWATSPERNGTLLRGPPTGESENGTSRPAPLGVPVVPLVRITSRGARAGFGGATRRRRCDQRLERVAVLAATVEPCPEASVAESEIADQRLELLVVDEQIDALAAGHLLDLRRRESRIHQHDTGAAFGGCKQCLEEAAVVASHDRDAVARLQARRAPRVGNRVYALIELTVGRLPSVIDHRNPIGMPDRRNGHGAAEHPVVGQRAPHLGHAPRRLDSRTSRCGSSSPGSRPRCRNDRRACWPARATHCSAGSTSCTQLIGRAWQVSISRWSTSWSSWCRLSSWS